MIKRIVFLASLILSCFSCSHHKNQILDTQKISYKCNENQCYLLLNNKRVRAQKYLREDKLFANDFEYFGEKKNFLRPLDLKEHEVYLLSESHGDGCPSIYRIVYLKKDLQISEAFGNCNEIKNITVNKETITADFKGLKEANRSPLHILYDIDKNQIHKNPGAIFIHCFMENKWDAKKQDETYFNLGAHSECEGFAKWQKKKKEYGSIIIGQDLSKVLTKNPLMIEIEGFGSRSIPRKGEKIITGLNLNKIYHIKVNYEEKVIKDWTINFSKLKTRRIKIYKSPGYWRLNPLR